MSNFSKPPLSIEKQIQLLKERGLVVENIELPEHFLKFVGFYRLKGYSHFFEQDEKHLYKNNTCFKDIIDLYNFDRKLRLLFLDAIECIEVSLRSVFVHQMSMDYGSHWYLNKKIFKEKFNHKKFIEILKREAKIDSGINL